MPSSSGWSSFFHVGARTWRAKTEDQSYLEHERKKFAEEAERKQAEVKQKIELLDQVRALEAKTQALNEMSLSAEIQTKEHELAMRERQMFESKQIELAKLELAKRMGEESLNEADFARVRRERMRAELLARQSNDHALREMERAEDQAELDERLATEMPQPPSFRSASGLPMPMRGHTPMTGPIPIPGSMSNPVPIPIPNHMPMSGPMSMPGFMPEHMSLPGHRHMSPSGPYPAFESHAGMTMGPHPRLRGRSDSFSAYPGDIGRGDWGSRSHMMSGHFPDNLDHQRMYSSNRDFRDPHGPASSQMALRTQAEMIRRKNLENLDQKAMQHNLQAQALREIRKGELIARLRERGAQQRQIEAEAAKLAEQDRRMDATQLREQRDREYRTMLIEKGLQDREIAEQLRRREEKDREFLQREVRKLEREMRQKELGELERAICEAHRNSKPPPMGIQRPSMDQIVREGFMDRMMDEFQELNPRLQQEILSMQAHYKPSPVSGNPRPRRPSMGSLNQTHMSRATTPQSREQIPQQMANQLYGEDPHQSNMRPGSKASSRDRDPGQAPLSRHNSTHENNNSPGPSWPRNRAPSRSLAGDSPALNALRHEFETESSEQILTSDNSLTDASLAARLQSAALNSELNGGRRSRASSRAGQMNDELPMSRHRAEPEPSLLNPNAGRRSRATTIAEQIDAEMIRGGSNYMGPEPGPGRRSRSNSAAQSLGSSVQSRMMPERPLNFGLGRSPVGSERDFIARDDQAGGQARNSRPPSRSMMPSRSMNHNTLRPEEMEQMSAMDASRSSSRCGTLSNNLSGLERRDSRNNSLHSTSPLNPSNGSSPINSKSLYSMSGRYGMYGGHGRGERPSSQDLYQHQDTREDLVEGDFIITEQCEHPGVTISDRLGRVEASSREKPSQPSPTVQVQVQARDDMHTAVRHLIAEASRRGANGIVSLRVSDSTDGSYLAYGEAVVFLPH